MSILAGGALGLAGMLAVSGLGLMPINERQMNNYLLAHPEILPAMMARAQALDDPAVAFVTGPADAKQTLVEFYDYDCPFCRASLPAVKKFYEANKDKVRFSFIEFPIKSLHGESAVQAARASLAARRQPAHYMDFHFALLGQEGEITDETIADEAAKAGMDVAKLKADMQDAAIEKSLAASIALAHKVGVDGTPTFVLNGKVHPGAMDEETLADEMKS
jgi:protein-disulfide isomerase